MTYEIVNGSVLREKIKATLKKSEGASLAVAYWGGKTIKSLGMNDARNLRIICNLSHGGTNPKVIRKLLENGATIKHHPNLHAKIGYMDGFSFLGSSNMSQNGLGDTSPPAHEEANVVFDHCNADIQKRFEGLWKASKDIDEETLKKAKVAWGTTKRAHAKAQVETSKDNIINQLIANPKRMDDFGLFVVIYSPVDKKTANKIDTENKRVKADYGGDCEVYYDWPELPRDAYLLDLEETQQGEFKWHGIFRRSPDVPDKQDFQLAFKTWSASDGNDQNSKIGAGGPWRIKAAVRAAIEAKAIPEADDDGARLFLASLLAPYFR